MLNSEPDSRHHDSGISIIEALISCVLIGVIAATAVPAFMGFYGGVKETKTEQNATSVAQSVLLHAATFKRLPDAQGCVPLLYGRTQTDALAQWDAANVPAGVDLEGLEPAFNPSGKSCPEKHSDHAVPRVGYKTQNYSGSVSGDKNIVGRRVGNVDFFVRTWIGKCMTSKTNFTTSSTPTCVTKAAMTSHNSTAKAGEQKYDVSFLHPAYQVVTYVRWTGTGCAQGSECSMTSRVTLEAGDDQVFYQHEKDGPNVSKAPRKRCVVKDSPAIIDLLAGVRADFAVEPVDYRGGVSQGQLGTAQDIRRGRPVYRPSPNRVYTGDVIRFHLTNTAGVKSDLVELEIEVKESCA